jgi:hypothetical protein
LHLAAILTDGLSAKYKYSEEDAMKSKLLVFLSTFAMAVALFAQTASQSTPAPNDNNSGKACSCCNHDQANGKMACSGKGAKCCASGDASCKGSDCCKGKDGKSCPMMSKDSDGKMSCCGGGGKCSMMSKKEGKSCCGGKMCTRPQSGA